MTKTEFLSIIAEKTNRPKKDADEFLKAFTEALHEVLKEGDSVSIPELGSFSVAQRKERECRNPRTGERMIVAATNNPKFRPAKALKDCLNK